METIKSKFDAETIYKVTGNAVTISRDGDEMKIPIRLIPEMAAPFVQEIKDELFEFFDKKYPEVPCPVCGKPMRQINKRKYCSDECINKIAVKRIKEKKLSETALKKINGVKKVCACCGKSFILYDNFHTKYCSPECKKEALSWQRRRQKRTPRKEPKKKRKISQCGEIERDARKIGLRYADIQKQETLAMVGKIHL